jgi:hypothetical protein
MDFVKSLYKFFSPKFQSIHLDYKVAAKPRYGKENPHALLYDIINQNRNFYSAFLKESLTYTEAFQSIKKANEESDSRQPVFNNDFLPGLDIFALYAMVAKFQPQTYLEVGSGNSTKVAYKAKNERSANTKIISIDPFPRVEIDALSDEVIRKPFEETSLERILALKENDILFIDNSHRILPNSDSMVFFMEIMPKLAKGVVVQVHDIYLPYDYPQFMCDRFYSEQYGLAMYLMANPKKFQTLLPNYFISEDKELSGIISEIWNHPNTLNVEKHGGSFWFRINE